MADLAADWAKAKDDYFALTGEKKPRESFAKFFSTSHTNLSKTIGKLAELKEKKPYPDKAKDYRKLVGEFKSASASYNATLEKLIAEEKKQTIKMSSVKEDAIVVEKITTARLKGMKMLKTRLEDYSATFEQLSAQFDSMANGETLVQRVEGTLAIGLKKGAKRALAASAAIKAKPTVAVWNAEMDDGVRSLTTALGAFKTLDKEYTKQNLPVPPHVVRDLNKANTWIVTLTPWASGAKRTLNDGADVMAELKPMMVEVKACIAAFADYMG